MKINKNLPTPLYHQVKNYLEEKVIRGEWEPGFQLPTERELAKHFSVSTITVKRAVHDLVDKGILYRQRGKGTFVNKKENIDKDIYQLVTLRNELKDNTPHPHKVLHFNKEEAGDVISKELNIKSNDQVFKIHRLKLEEDEAVGIEYTYIPTTIIPEISIETIDNDLIYNMFVNKFGIKLGKAKIFFSTIVATELEAALLNISVGEQLMVLERYTYTESELIVEYSKFIIIQDKSRYFIEVRL